jgi:hypothetical protein
VVGTDGDMTKHDALVEAARKAIDELFADTTVSRDRTRRDLIDLRDHIGITLDALPTDGDDE